MEGKSRVVEKNKEDWNANAENWAKLNHAERMLRPVLEFPPKAFPKTIWELLRKYYPDFKGKRICVPSSGDNHAVFAFALLGAQVTSCDISENQLANAKRIAEREGISKSIAFVCTDTMTLEGIADEEYDLVYTSNGVHVWLDDLPSMYRNVYRVLKRGGMNLFYDIHPFLRPFDSDMKLIKPYDCTGPFEDEVTVSFHWRIQDILNAVMDAGISLLHVEELFDEKNYERPFGIKAADLIRGIRADQAEVDRMYDWKENPYMGLPSWLCVVGKKD